MDESSSVPAATDPLERLRDGPLPQAVLYRPEPTPRLTQRRTRLATADLIVRSALHRHESRGLHFTLDYPATLPDAVDTVLVP